MRHPARIIGAAALAAFVLLAGCATQPDTRKQKQEVAARLRHYSDLMLAMDSRALADMFAPEGEIVNPRRPPVRGRAAIREFLASYSDFKVLSNEDTQESIVVEGATAEQLGTYRQKVRTPEGTLLEVSGRFEFAWVQDGSGNWLIQQAATFPDPKP